MTGMTSGVTSRESHVKQPMRETFKEGDILIVHRQFRTHTDSPLVIVGTIFVVVNVNQTSHDIDIISNRFQICWRSSFDNISNWFKRVDKEEDTFRG